MKFLAMILLLVVSLKSYAEQARGGGVYECAEYSDLAGRIAVSLIKVGQKKINEYNPVIKAEEIWQKKRKLKCLPVTKQDRTAISDSVTVTTTLLPLEWNKLNYAKKVRLVTHELAVLTEYENDGEYFISVDINKILMQETNDFRIGDYTAKEITINPDGSVTLVVPYILRPDEDSETQMAYFGDDSEGVCRYFGFKKDVHHRFGTFKDDNFQHMSKYVVSFVDYKGRIYNTSTFTLLDQRKPQLVIGVTCK